MFPGYSSLRNTKKLPPKNIHLSWSWTPKTQPSPNSKQTNNKKKKKKYIKHQGMLKTWSCCVIWGISACEVILLASLPTPPVTAACPFEMLETFVYSSLRRHLESRSIQRWLHDQHFALSLGYFLQWNGGLGRGQVDGAALRRLRGQDSRPSHSTAWPGAQNTRHAKLNVLREWTSLWGKHLHGPVQITLCKSGLAGRA